MTRSLLGPLASPRLVGCFAFGTALVVGARYRSARGRRAAVLTVAFVAPLEPFTAALAAVAPDTAAAPPRAARRDALLTLA